MQQDTQVINYTNPCQNLANELKSCQNLANELKSHASDKLVNEGPIGELECFFSWSMSRRWYRHYTSR